MASRCSRLNIGRLLHYENCTAKTRFFSSGKERKRRVMSKEDRAEAVNSFVKQYMLQFPGKFPTFTLVTKEVGGSADVLRKLLAELKMSSKMPQDQKQNADVDGVYQATKSIAPENLSADAESNAATLMEINSLNQKVPLSFDNMSEIDTAVSQQEALLQSIKKESVAQPFSDQSSLPLSMEKSCTDFNGGQEGAKSEAPEKLSTETESKDATDLEIESLQQKASLSFDNILGNDVTENQIESLLQPIEKGELIMEKLCTDVNDGAQEATKSEAPENLSTDTKSIKATDLEIDSLKQKASLSFDNITGNDVCESQNRTLSQSIEKREPIVESFSDVNDDAEEAAKSIAPENLTTEMKSNDAAGLEIDSLKRKAPLSFSNVSGNDIPEDKKQSLSPSTRKEELISDQSLLPVFLKKLFGENIEKYKYEKNYSIDPASPEGSSGTNLLGNQGKTSFQSLNNKYEPEIASDKIENHKRNEEYSSVHSKGLPSANINKYNLEVDKMREGIPVAEFIHVDEVAVENNSNKKANCSNLTLKNLEQDKLGELNVVQSINLDERKIGNITSKEVNNKSFDITSDSRSLCGSNTPIKIVSEKSIEVGYTQHAQGFSLSPKVDNKQKGRGSDLSENMSSLGTNINTQTRIWQQTKQFRQNQWSRNFPSVDALLDHKDSDDEGEDDSDFAAFDYPESDRRPQIMIPQKNNGLAMSEFSEPKNLKCLLIMFLPRKATAVDLVKAFGHCGKIDEVKIIPSKREENRFNYASIIFSTEEAFQKALMKKSLCVCGSELFLKMASSSNQNVCQDSAPRVAENIALSPPELKYSRCTIMIKDLPPAINFQQLKNALVVFGTVSHILMGPLNSTIYVEFETDDAKERALAGHWICIGGQQLQIRSVETPRTSVVRISNVSSETWNPKIYGVCSSFGRVNKVIRRAQDIVDVHFHQSELANMVDILDSLNGVFMNQCHWHAQSATVFSHETLASLWSSADGREYLHSVIQNLFKVINKKCFNENDVRELAAQYYVE